MLALIFLFIFLSSIKLHVTLTHVRASLLVLLYSNFIPLFLSSPSPVFISSEVDSTFTFLSEKSNSEFSPEYKYINDIFVSSSVCLLNSISKLLSFGRIADIFSVPLSLTYTFTVIPFPSKLLIFSNKLLISVSILSIELFILFPNNKFII